MEREKFLKSLSKKERHVLSYHWPFWARPNQMAPEGGWFIWLILAGRGFGKTRSGAEWIREKAQSGSYKHLAIVAETSADARDVMVEGPSGILSVSRSDFRPLYEPSKRRLTWPNGVWATTYSADDPEQLRGPEHSAAWCDEIGKWKYHETWDNLVFGLRIGDKPQCCATTTPKPVRLVRDLAKRAKTEPDVVVLSKGSTYENKENLAGAFLKEITAKYEGTRLGRQELRAELLEEAEGALWSREMVEAARIDKRPEMKRIVVSVDPAITAKAESDETGIIVCGLGEDGLGYILRDVTGRFSPNEWATRAVNVYHEFKADRIVAEKNQGGDMVRTTIETVDKSVPITLIHASRGKRTRAEPVAALYEQDRIKHLGPFEKLEDDMCTWEPNSGAHSPDRMDAMVHGFTDLMLGQPAFEWYVGD